MQHILLVGLGGFIGSIARYLLGAWILVFSSPDRFPLGTFAINAIGCLTMGILAGLAEKFEWFSLEARLFLLTGLLGGFTTFSAFGLETVGLLRRGEVGLAIAYVSASVGVGITGVWLGAKIVKGSWDL